MRALLDNIFANRWLWLGMCAAVFVCLPLFFYSPCSDWYNQIWMADYAARYFRAHGTFPVTLNTFQIIGLQFPVFYGYLFFPTVGALSTILSASGTYRLLVLLVFCGQYFFLYKTVARWTGNNLFAFTLGTLTTCTIYPLTNLYTRGAAPEFFACGLLTFACLSLFRAMDSEQKSQIWAWVNLSALCLCAAAGTHAITALYGSLFYAILLSILFILRGWRNARKVALPLIVGALLSTTCLAPWAMATARYNRQLSISDSFREVSYFPKTIDGLPMRLCPIPIPPYYLRHKASDEHMGTPGLNAPINTPELMIFLLLLLSVFRRSAVPAKLRWSMLTFACLMVALTYVSSTQSAFQVFGYYARSIQFAYRLVTYINLAMLVGILLPLWQCRPVYIGVLRTTALEQSSGKADTDSKSSKHPGETDSEIWHATARETSVGPKSFNPSRSLTNAGTFATASGINGSLAFNPMVCAFLIVVALTATSFKLYQTLKVHQATKPLLASSYSDANLLQLPFEFYGHPNYSMPRHAKVDAETNHSKNFAVVMLEPAQGKDFGYVKPVELARATRGWTCTNVEFSDWNRLCLNSKLIHTDNAFFRPITILKSRPLDDSLSIALKNPPGGVLQYVLLPDSAWVVINSIARPLFFAWCIATALASALIWLSSQQSGRIRGTTSVPTGSGSGQGQGPRTLPEKDIAATCSAVSNVAARSGEMSVLQSNVKHLLSNESER